MFDPRITDPYAHYWVHQAYTALNYRGGLATYCALCSRTSTVPIENTIASHGRIPPRTPPPTGGDKREEGERSPARSPSGGGRPSRRKPTPELTTFTELVRMECNFFADDHDLVGAAERKPTPELTTFTELVRMECNFFADDHDLVGAAELPQLHGICLPAGGGGGSRHSCQWGYRPHLLGGNPPPHARGLGRPSRRRQGSTRPPARRG